MVSPVEELELNSKELFLLCNNPENAFNCKNSSKSLFFRIFSYPLSFGEGILKSSEAKYILPSVIIHKVNEFLPIRVPKKNLSEKNYTKLKDLSHILYSGMPRSGYFAALKASAERLRAKRIDGKKVIVVQPIYHHNGEQLPGYRLILEDDSQKIITRVDYSTGEKETLIYQTLIIFIENIYIPPVVTKRPFYNFEINSLQIINKEVHYKNPLPDEEIKEYSTIVYRILEEELLQFSAFVKSRKGARSLEFNSSSSTGDTI